MKAWELIKDLVNVWPPSNNFVIEGITPTRNNLFVVGGSLLGSNKGDYILAFKTQSDPTQDPQYMTMYDLTPTLSPASTSNLPQAIAVNGSYAYIASGRSFCTTLSDCGQLIVINVSKVKKARTIGGKKITDKDVALFTRQLATMLKAGVPLLQSFDIVAKGHSNPSMGRMLTQHLAQYLDPRRVSSDDRAPGA